MMHMLAVVLLFFASDVLRPSVREVPLSGKLSDEPSVKKPVVITTPEEAEKVYGKRILKDGTVDFATEQILCFGWVSSSGDVLTAKMEAGEVVFTYVPGITRDLFVHSKSFVIPKTAKWRLITKFR